MKNLRMISGIILHPAKMVFFYLNGGASRFDILKWRANDRNMCKASERRLYMASLTHTPINL